MIFSGGGGEAIKIFTLFFYNYMRRKFQRDIRFLLVEKILIKFRDKPKKKKKKLFYPSYSKLSNHYVQITTNYYTYVLPLRMLLYCQFRRWYYFFWKFENKILLQLKYFSSTTQWKVRPIRKIHEANNSHIDTRYCTTKTKYFINSKGNEIKWRKKNIHFVKGVCNRIYHKLKTNCFAKHRIRLPKPQWVIGYEESE